MLAAFQESFQVAEKPRSHSGPRLLLASTGTGQGQPAQWEVRLREEYLSRFGPPLLPLPESLEHSRLFLALKLSPRYLGEGVRQAARELFSSPIFLASITLSVLVYFAAWLAPEPLFTKAFAVTLTVGVTLVVGTDGAETKAGYQWHHLATNKNDLSTRSGGPWTPLFEELFELAEMHLDVSENRVYLKGHKGPHPEKYHWAVYEKLSRALHGCETVSRCRSKLAEALKEIANEVCTPGSYLHRLATKPHE